MEAEIQGTIHEQAFKMVYGKMDNLEGEKNIISIKEKLKSGDYIVVGIPVIYAFGAGWMKHVTGQPWGAVIVQSIIPFIPLDIVKCVAAVALGKALKRTGLFGN